MSGSSSSNSSNPIDNALNSMQYTGQYTVSPQMQEFWENLFQGPLTAQELSQLTDGLVQNVCNSINEVTNWAMEQRQQREEEEQDAQQ